jgi:hypothetical protein
MYLLDPSVSGAGADRIDGVAPCASMFALTDPEGISALRARARRAKRQRRLLIAGAGRAGGADYGDGADGGDYADDDDDDDDSDGGTNGDFLANLETMLAAKSLAFQVFFLSSSALALYVLSKLVHRG